MRDGSGCAHPRCTPPQGTAAAPSDATNWSVAPTHRGAVTSATPTNRPALASECPGPYVQGTAMSSLSRSPSSLRATGGARRGEGPSVPPPPPWRLLGAWPPAGEQEESSTGLHAATPQAAAFPLSPAEAVPIGLVHLALRPRATLQLDSTPDDQACGEVAAEETMLIVRLKQPRRYCL